MADTGSGAPGAAAAAEKPPHEVVTVANVSSTVMVVCNFWKEFDLEGLRSKLDEEGMAIAENQEASVKKRRELAEVTREFKKKRDASVKDFNALLKGYQEEIDRITKRAKFGESSFLALYQKLYEAPDPAMALNSALESISRSAELEARVRKMAQELADFKAESQGIKNQEVTIKKLEEQVRSQAAALEERDRQLAEALESAAAEADARQVSEVKMREAALSKALQEAQENFAKLQSTHAATQNQLFAVTSQSEEESAGVDRQLELAAEEMERAESRFLQLQREKAAMAAQLQKLKEQGLSEPADAATAQTESLRRELSAQRERASHLQAELAASHRELADLRAAHESRVGGLRRALEAQEGRSAALEQELAGRPSAAELDKLRQQVRALQAVGFSQVDGEDGDDAAKKLGPPGSLEAMLLEKNRRLEHELTRCKLASAELRGEVAASVGAVAELQAALEEKAALVEQLEESVASLNLASRDDSSGPSRSASGLGGADAPEEEQTMITVVCQQRDRFRKRCLEMEEAVARSSQEALSAQNDLKAARADNVALVERMRYLQGYKGGVSPGTGSRRQQAGDVESRYAAEYEEQLNPFAKFQEKQRDNQRKRLSVADKAVLSAGSLILGNKYARLFAFVYTILLHCMVFAVLFRMSHHTHHTHVKAEMLASKDAFLQSAHNASSAFP
eukprot:jgi/Tetstr1/449614/TSEL_036701.t1